MAYKENDVIKVKNAVGEDVRYTTREVSEICDISSEVVFGILKPRLKLKKIFVRWLSHFADTRAEDGVCKTMQGLFTNV